MDGDLIVLDCIGYTQEMKEMFCEEDEKTGGICPGLSWHEWRRN